MKYFYLMLIASSMLQTAQGEEFSSVTSCGNRSLVVDQASTVQYAGRGAIMGVETRYQVVLRNSAILADFVAKGAIAANAAEINQRGEFVSGLISDHGSKTDFYSVFGGGRTLTVRIRGNTVFLNVYSSANTGSQPLANFVFRDCQ